MACQGGVLAPNFSTNFKLPQKEIVMRHDPGAPQKCLYKKRLMTRGFRNAPRVFNLAVMAHVYPVAPPYLCSAYLKKKNPFLMDEKYRS